MRIQMQVAALAACLALTGCGISTIQEQDGHLRSLALNVVMSQTARNEAVAGILSTLKSTNQIDEGTTKEFESSLASVEAVQFKATTELSNALVRDLDARYKTLNAAEDAVLDAAAAAIKTNAKLFAPSELQRLRGGIDADPALVSKINVAKARYLVDVQSFNQVIGLFPTSVTAKMIGEDQRVAFSLADRQASKDNAGKLIEVALSPNSLAR